MRRLNSQWRLSIGWCLLVFVEAYGLAAEGAAMQI